MRSPRKLTILGAAAVVLTIGAAPIFTSAADHIDASAFGSLTQDGGTTFNPLSVNGERDINDVYAFQGSDASRTVLIMTTNPAINAFMTKFGANVRYILNVDRDGDAVQDLAYVVRFDDGAAGDQKYEVTRYTGANAVSLAQGNVRGSGSTAGNGTASLKGDGRVFAGVRSDPFFFDLTGFVGSLFGIGMDALSNHPTCTMNTPTDIFTGFNTNAIVIEVPDDQLGGAIGVWGQTTYTLDSGSTWLPGDQMGRPAINTVFNTSLVDTTASATKSQFNATPPSQQNTGKFRANVVATLMALGGYTVSEAGGLADRLLPDVLTYDTATTAAFSNGLNGRDLNDDVIDIELNIVTQGGITGDCVGPHETGPQQYLEVFPYLGVPLP